MFSINSENKPAIMAEQQEVPNYLETPEGRRLAYFKSDGSTPGVVYIHGLKSDMTGIKARSFEDCCRAKGKAYVRFDLSGHGRSSESFAQCNVSTWLEDVNAVLSTLTSGPQILIGSSIGGWLMFLYTMRNPEKVCGLIGIGAAPDYTANLWRSLDKDTQKQVKRSGLYKLPYPEPYEISMQLIQDGDKYSILDMPGLEIIQAPVWLFHGELDSIVPTSSSLFLVQRLNCPVTLKTVPDGDHRLSRPQDVQLVTEALLKLLNGEGIADPGDDVDEGCDPGDEECEPGRNDSSRQEDGLGEDLPED